MYDNCKLVNGVLTSYYENSIYESSIYNKTTGIIRFKKRFTDEYDDVFLGEKFNYVYNRQFGIPISNDGKYFLTHGWEKKHGLSCYSIETGKLHWRIEKKHAYGSAFYGRENNKILCYFMDFGFLLIDLYSGNIIKEIKIRGMEFATVYSDFVCTKRNKDITLYVLKDDDLQLIRHIRQEEYNIHSYENIVVSKVEIIDDKVVLYGRESHYYGTELLLNNNEFVRTIDL